MSKEFLNAAPEVNIPNRHWTCAVLPLLDGHARENSVTHWTSVKFKSFALCTRFLSSGDMLSFPSNVGHLRVTEYVRDVLDNIFTNAKMRMCEICEIENYMLHHAAQCRSLGWIDSHESPYLLSLQDPPQPVRNAAKRKSSENRSPSMRFSFCFTRLSGWNGICKSGPNICWAKATVPLAETKNGTDRMVQCLSDYVLISVVHKEIHTQTPNAWGRSPKVLIIGYYDYIITF